MIKKVDCFTWDYLDSNMYVLKKGSHLLVIDPIDKEDALDYCKNADTITVILTHEHFDHICGLNLLRSMAPNRVKVIASRECSKRIGNPKFNMSAYADILMALAEKSADKVLQPISCVAADIIFHECYSFDWLEDEVELITTPGHSPGSVCIVIDNKLFSGDTLLENSFMNRFPGGDTKLYKEITLPLLKALLQRVKFVYPGHGAMLARKMAINTLHGIEL